MCTAISLFDKEHYFGRTLDLERSYGEHIVITPRKFTLKFRHEGETYEHFALIGTAIVAEGFPLYFEAVNERGLCAAGLNFAGFAKYREPRESFYNIEGFELIPWVLSRCKDACEAKELLERTNICGNSFNGEMGAPTLHWIFGDGVRSIVVESVAEGVKIYENEVGVLTNSPEFPYHMLNLSNYAALTPYPPKSSFGLDLKPYSRGMGAIGLPGDCSSTSRFVRAAFNKLNSVAENSEESRVSRIFHILTSVEQIEGAVRLEGGELVKTVYTSCINATRGIFYYTTYESRRIRAVNMRAENFEGDVLIAYPMSFGEDILFLE